MNQPRPELGLDDGRLALIVDGAVQSIDPPEYGPQPGYWQAMLPSVRPRNALILGLGGGTIATLLRRRFGSVPITGVEIDEEVAELARTRFGQDDPATRIVVGDAFEFVEACKDSFDYVAVDLFVGPVLVTRALAKPFLRALRRIAGGTGLVVYNLTLTRRLPQYLDRLGLVFRIEQAIDVEFNVVVHLRSRFRGYPKCRRR